MAVSQWKYKTAKLKNLSLKNLSFVADTRIEEFTFKIGQDKILFMIEEGGLLNVSNSALQNLIIEL